MRWKHFVEHQKSAATLVELEGSMLADVRGVIAFHVSLGIGVLGDDSEEYRAAERKMVADARRWLAGCRIKPDGTLIPPKEW